MKLHPSLAIFLGLDWPLEFLNSQQFQRLIGLCKERGNTSHFLEKEKCNFLSAIEWENILNFCCIPIFIYLQKISQNDMFQNDSMGREHVSHKKKPYNYITFHYNGCLIGIRIMVYYNPHMTGQYNPLLVGGFNPSEKCSSKWVHLPQFSGWK